jgi:hypothetical protein
LPSSIILVSRLGVVMDRGNELAMLRVGSDQNFIHFLLVLMKGPNKIVKGHVGCGPLPCLHTPYKAEPSTSDMFHSWTGHVRWSET